MWACMKPSKNMIITYQIIVESLRHASKMVVVASTKIQMYTAYVWEIQRAILYNHVLFCLLFPI